MSNSDYTKPRHNIFELLPQVLQSDANRAIFENSMNRYFTKTELLRIIGFIGQGNPNALIQNQIIEPDPHRQAYQLQPLLYNKIGTVEHISSSRDIYNELERLGIDVNRLKLWGNATSFNWSPPIDFDKLLRFRDYYWVDTNNIGAPPQYFTIQNPCNRIEAKISQYQITLDEFGEEHPITNIEAEGSPTVHSFTISSNMELIFTVGFIFKVRNSTNTTINDMFFTTISSEFIGSLNSTKITFNYTSMTPLNTITIDGIISLVELKDIFLAERDCICSGSVGWDGAQWDDNQLGTVIWNQQLLLDITFPTDITWIVNNGGLTPDLQDLWYDTTTNTLKQYTLAGPNDPSPIAYDINAWIIVQTNFSSLIQFTTGENLWDQTLNCPGMDDYNQWQIENKWVHKNHVENFTIAKRAQIPIIEYLDGVELNAWSKVVHTWKYRRDNSVQFTETVAETQIPTLLELININHPDTNAWHGGYVIDPALDMFTIDEHYGDMTDIFIAGFEFNMKGSLPTTGSPVIASNNGIYEVLWSKYCEVDTSGSPNVPERFQTIVKLATPFISINNSGYIEPMKTSFDDFYLGLHQHWLFVGVANTLPECNQPINPMLGLFTTTVLDDPINSRWLTTNGLYSQEWTITTTAFQQHQPNTFGAFIAGNTIVTIIGNYANDLNDLISTSDLKVKIFGNSNPAINGTYDINIATVDVGLNTELTIPVDISSGVNNTGFLEFQWRIEPDCSIHERSKLGAFEARFYIDNVRQYGTYIESSKSTTCGSPISDVNFVNSIVINTPIPKFSILRMEVGAAASSELGLEYIPVRTEEDDTLFQVSPIPFGFETFNLTKKVKTEQVKAPLQNQYPIFDMYDIQGACLNIVSSVFKFEESQDAPIDINTRTRIVKLDDDVNYSFEQFLVEENNGRLYTYRDAGLSSDFWFDSDNDILYAWTGVTWSTKIRTEDNCYTTMIVSKNEPGAPFDTILGAVWFNLNNNSIYFSDGMGTFNIDILATQRTQINDTDPTIISIWKTGPDNVECENKIEYIPEYVDKDRNPIAIGDIAGDWELPDQLFFNTHHENRKILQYAELIAHFNSIIDEQEPIPGMFGDARTLFHIKTDIHYGVGGTIKEYNDSYDSLLATTFVKNVNVLELIEFAHDAYENALNTLKEFFRSDIAVLMNDITPEGLSDLSNTVSNKIITLYEQNDAVSLVFGDSNTFNETTGLGVRNWPATLPYTRLQHAVSPQHYYDFEQDFNEIRHHDSHLSHVNFTETSLRAFITRILIYPDARTTNPTGQFGHTDTALPLDSYNGEQGFQIVNFSVPKISSDPAGLISGTTYTANIIVDGITYPISLLANGTETFLTIGSVIDAALSGVGGSTLPAFTTELIVTSATISSTSNVSIIDGATPFFGSLTNFSSISTAVQGTNGYEPTFGATTGIYWYYLTGTVQELYRMSVVEFSDSNPGISFPEGSFWYDTLNNDLMILQLGVWVSYGLPIGQLSDFGNSDFGAWQAIDMNRMMANMIFDVETRLYQNAPQLDQTSFDYTTLDTEPTLRDEYFAESFSKFLAQTETTTPFVNIDYDASDPFTWNYVTSTPAAFTPKPATAVIQGGTWEDVYKKNYGTPYPQFEPWILQGYTSKPTWWDTTYADGIIRPRWTTTMWNNILAGIVPAGEFLPNGDISTGVVTQQIYQYVSVNIDSVTHDGYAPDDIFPPFWIPVGSPPINVRSIFDTLGQINDPDENYIYDDAGVVEWNWENSSQYLYDQLMVAYRMQPMRFIHDTLGEEYVDVNCLQVSERTEKVLAHQDQIFHGDLLDDNTIIKFEGLLQWYVNFNRFGGYDSSYSDFRSMWTDWLTPLSYQFGSFIDTKGFLISNNGFDVVEQDYFITSKRSPGIADFWLDSFNIVLLKTAGGRLDSATQDNWQFELQTFSPIGRPIEYYAMKRYNFIVLPEASPIEPSNTMQIIADPILGLRIPTWITGSEVVFTTTENLPSPLVSGVIYYIIKVTDTTFRLSSDKNGVNVIDLLTFGNGIQDVGEIRSTFEALGGQTTSRIWYNLETDKTNVLTFNPPITVTGIQNIIDIFNGYSEFEEDIQQFRFNVDTTELDFQTGRPIDWQLEIERFIDFAFRAQINESNTQDTFESSVDDMSDEFTFTRPLNTEGLPIGSTPGWGTTTRVYITSALALPQPLEINTYYYIIRIDENRYKLAESSKNAKNNIAINILGNGSGFFVSKSKNLPSNPDHEVNPFKYNVFLNHPLGIMSDIIKGPFFDVRTEPAILDQFKRPLPLNNTFVYREDKESHINVSSDIGNDLLPTSIDPYDSLHITSAHLFIDGYEHVLIFQDYSTDNVLIYDRFLGLSTSKFNVQFDRSPIFNLRPNLGGYVITNPQPGEENVGLRVIRNMEGQTEDLRNIYDTFRVSEANDLIEQGRASIGYNGSTNFLDAININPKSQFVFWRGMIQNKGSINAINAFINSRLFVDAKLDEFWAFKLADFGDAKEQTIPEMNLFENDAKFGDLKIEFTSTGIGPQTVDMNFENVTNTTIERWLEHPNQQEFFNIKNMMCFNAKIIAKTDFTSNIIGSPIITDLELDNKCNDIRVIDSTGGLAVEGIAYTKINDLVLRFLVGGTFTIWQFCPIESKHNPSKIRDNITDITVSLAPIYDPARGHYYHNAINLVDAIQDADPAIYQYDPAQPPVWGQREETITWWDTNEIGYQPYYDHIIFPNIDDRLLKWGRIKEWSAYKFYQWTASDVPPAEYDTLARSQELDAEIPDSTRVTGRVRRVLQRASLGSPSVFEDMPFTKYDLKSRIFYDQSTLEALFNYPLGDIGVTDSEPCAIYQNGIFVATATTYADVTNIINVGIGSPPTPIFSDSDNVDVVRFLPLPTAVNGTEYRFVVPFTTENILINNISTPKFFFWVENKTVQETNRNKTLSMVDAVQDMLEYPIPYIVIQKLLEPELDTLAVAPTGILTGSPPGTGSPPCTQTLEPLYKELLPRRYVQVILRKFNSLINDSNRYVLRFTRDFTLRDTLDDYYASPMNSLTWQDPNAEQPAQNLNETYTEWQMFREEQQFNIPRILWNRMIASIIGENIIFDTTMSKYIPSGERIPSLSRELFDRENNASTRYGFGTGQSFTDGILAWDTILAYLRNPNNDFTPITIEAFFIQHDINNLVPMTSKQETIDLLSEIYNTFTFFNVNRMFFGTLHDALSRQTRYNGLFKTSMLSLHGIKILDVGGQFDT